MLPELELDVLHYLDRAALEGLQMHSRYLRDLVDCHARKLALRGIVCARIADGAAWIHLAEHNPTLAHREEDGEMLLHRFNNAFIHGLLLSFHQEDLHLLHYLRANADVLQSQIGDLRIKDTTEVIDYALVDFVGAHLKPQFYMTAVVFHEFHEDYFSLFAHNALRGNVKRLVYILYGPPAPTINIPKLFGVDVVETCTIATDVDPRPWIGVFIRTFETAERGADMVRSVTLLDTHFYEGPPSPRHTVEPFGPPRRTDAPAPRSCFIRDWAWERFLMYGTTTTEATVGSPSSSCLRMRLRKGSWTFSRGLSSILARRLD